MVYPSIRNIERAATFIGRCTERNLLMKRKKLLPLAAAAFACGVLIAAPQAASALAPDQAAPEVLGQANDYYYYEDDGYISYDDTYGYTLRTSNNYDVDKDGLTLKNEAEYASFVESKGFDVLSGAALYAEKRLKEEFEK